ncbi:hypothetical protein [Natrinema limicola]|uniref:Uncharacterized protein n=1 Tax=Natrinema limicola JCM 13563 TaxID=1230457 RepID=M0BZY5_9EURY|nr:hypothetical protein [Natrinema limicola]ELZ15983.1 hypothetical protein C476_17247 [Natrinema limicola JCM 13563]
MRIPQLTLYDFLADFLPGAVALGLFGSLLWLAGFFEPPIITSTGIVLVVTSYPVGRSIHAATGQIEIKKLRERTFDKFVFTLESTRSSADLLEPDMAIVKKPSVRKRLNPESDCDCEISNKRCLNDWIDEQVMEAFTESDDNESTDGIPQSVAAISTADIQWAEMSYGQLQRFGFSELFDASTLYHRYNILNTFYRNLWLVSAYFSILFFTVGLVDILAPAPLWIRLSIIATGILTVFGAIVFQPLLWGVSAAFTWGLILVLNSMSVFLTLPDWTPFSVVETAVWLVILLLLGIVGYSTCWSENHNTPSITSLPPWYLLLGLLVCLTVFVFPIGLLFNQMPQSRGLDTMLFGSISLILFVLAVLFDVRRIQFKDRQVRAFINDLYRQQQASGDQD